MGKKQFIRHLEFYGFPDQNKYFSDGNGPDLSSIIEKINELDELKADKVALDAFENEVNENIDLLKNTDEIFDERINFIESSITDIQDEIEIINNNFDVFEEKINEISGDVSVLFDGVNAISDNVNELSGNFSTFKENVYTKDEIYTKDEVYNKNEIEDIITSGHSGFATIEWVEEQGYITENEADEKFALEDDFETSISGINDNISLIEETLEETSEDVNVIKENIEYISGVVSSNTETITTKANEEDLQALSASVNSILNDINAIDESIEGQEVEINDINNSINTINRNINTINGDINDINASLLTKAEKRDLDEARVELSSAINTLNSVKADKTDLNYVSGAVGTLDEKVDNEITRAQNAENAINSEVNAMGTKVNSAVTVVEGFDERINGVETGLTKEISDREQADLNLIGNEGDYDTANTIWGAKAYSNEVGRKSISSAITYVDNKYNEFNTALLNLSAATDQKITAKADETYVNESVNDAKVLLRSEFEQADETISAGSVARDAEINQRIEVLQGEVYTGLSGAVADNSTKLAKLTSWDGTGSYDDYTKTPAANGIIDDVWRELHDLLETLTQKGILP